MQEALAERVLQEVIVPDLDEVDEHGALALALVRYQHPGLKKSRVSVIQDMRCEIRCKINIRVCGFEPPFASLQEHLY